MRTGIPEKRQVVRDARGAGERLPRLIGTRLEVRSELPKERSVVHDPGDTGERAHRLLRKRLGLQVGLSATRRQLYFKRRVEAQ